MEPGMEGAALFMYWFFRSSLFPSLLPFATAKSAHLGLVLAYTQLLWGDMEIADFGCKVSEISNGRTAGRNHTQYVGWRWGSNLWLHTCKTGALHHAPKGDTILEGDSRRPLALDRDLHRRREKIFRGRHFCFSAVMKGARVEGQGRARKPASFEVAGKGKV